MNLVKLKKFYKDKRVFITGHTGFKELANCGIVKTGS